MIDVNIEDIKLNIGHHLLFEGEDYSVYVLVEPCGLSRFNTVAPHIHTDWDESWFIYKGMYEITVGDKVIIAMPGRFIEVDRNVVHSVKSIHGNSVRLAIFNKGVEIKYAD